MHWGLFISLRSAAGILTSLIALVIVLIAIYLVLFTQLGLIVIPALIIYVLYRLLRKH